MPVKKEDLFSFGGVSSRDNPANFPKDRAIRCRNYAVLPSGQIRLRYGYSSPSMSTISATAIHSAAYYEVYTAGTAAVSQFVLYGQGTALNKYNIATDAVTSIATLAAGNAWGHFRSKNRIFIGNGTDFDSYDGTTLRPVGIRVPTSGEAGGVSAAASNVPTNPTGTFAVTVLSGYQFYMCYWNTITGHVGNRISIGARVTIGTTGYAVVLSGLPSLSGVNTEWVKLLGRTDDGGVIPHALIDGSGNRISANNTATVATLTSSVVDPTQELPYLNGVPLALTMFARVGTKIFGARPGDVNLYYSGDETDDAQGNFVGVPAESWASTAVEPFPTGEVPTAIHAYQFEGWFFSKNNLAIFSNFLFQQGSNPWRGPYPAGCAGQRAFTVTPYGPAWVTYDKQLMGWANGPVPISEEYEASLLQKMGDQYIGNTEVVYYRNAELGIDRIYVQCQDSSGNPFTVVHDYRLKEFKSQIGQGYEFYYQGMSQKTFIGSGYTPKQLVRDSNGRERLWCGDATGNLRQLEDGSVLDGASNYTGDYIALINVGNDAKLVAAVEWQGDGNASFSYSVQADAALGSFVSAATLTIENTNVDNRYEAQIGLEARWLFGRFQLGSHGGGNFAITDPPFVPVPSYGIINAITPKFGASRRESR